MKLEGVLKEINSVASKRTEKGSNVIQNYVECGLLIISKKGGKETENEIKFPGMVFPDSIGNNVSLKIEEIPGTSTTRQPICVGKNYELIDPSLNRTYSAIEKW